MHEPAAPAHSNLIRTILLLVAIAGVAALWWTAVGTYGFGAFIYPMLALVLAAFAFTLTLTRN